MSCSVALCASSVFSVSKIGLGVEPASFDHRPSLTQRTQRWYGRLPPIPRPSRQREGSPTTGLGLGGLAVNGIECQSGVVTQPLETEAPKWIVRLMQQT